MTDDPPSTDGESIPRSFATQSNLTRDGRKLCQSDGCGDVLNDRSDGRGTRFTCPTCGGTWLEGSYTDDM